MFLGCFFPALKHNFNHKKIDFCGYNISKNEIIVFSLPIDWGKQINDCANSNGPPTVIVLFDSALQWVDAHFSTLCYLSCFDYKMSELNSLTF